MTDSKPIYRSLVKKRIELQPLPTPSAIPPTQSEQSQIPSEQTEIGLEDIDEHVDEYIDSSVTATKPLSNSGWDVAQLLKEWRLDGFT